MEGQVQTSDYGADEMCVGAEDGESGRGEMYGVRDGGRGRFKVKV
jgi:hypothetical protein